MKYFAPCPEVTDAYTTIILQQLNYYRSRLKQVQALAQSTIPWGESVKPGRHQSKTIDKKKRGQGSIYLFDSEEEDEIVTQQSIEDSAFENAAPIYDKDTSNASPVFEVLRKRKVNNIEPTDSVTEDDHKCDQVSLNNSKRQKITETLVDRDQKYDPISSSITNNAKVITPNKPTGDSSPEKETVNVSRCFEKKVGLSDSSPLLSQTTPGVRKSPDLGQNEPTCHDDDEMLLQQQIKHRRNQRNTTKPVTKNCEMPRSPKFQKKILRKKVTESMSVSDDESLPNSATSSISTTMLDSHGDLFSTQVCSMKEKADKHLSQITNDLQSPAKQGSKLNQLFDGIYEMKIRSNSKVAKLAQQTKVELQSKDDNSETLHDKKGIVKIKKMVVVSKQPEKKVINNDDIINVDSSESNSNSDDDREYNKTYVDSGPSTQTVQPCVAVKGCIDGKKSKLSLATKGETPKHISSLSVKPLVRTHTNTKMTPKHGDDTDQSGITPSEAGQVDRSSTLNKTAGEECLISRAAWLNTPDGGRVARMQRSARSSSTGNDDRPTYRTPRSVTRKRQVNEEQMSPCVKSAKQVLRF